MLLMELFVQCKNNETVQTRHAIQAAAFIQTRALVIKAVDTIRSVNMLQGRIRYPVLARSN